MTRVALIGMLVLLGGCSAVRIGDDVVPPVTMVEEDGYTKADIDAINAKTQCRALARTMVQISRCDVRR